MSLCIFATVCYDTISHLLTLSWRRPLSYRNHPIDLQSKSMDWFLYDNGLRHERVNYKTSTRLKYLIYITGEKKFWFFLKDQYSHYFIWIVQLICFLQRENHENSCPSRKYLVRKEQMPNRWCKIPTTIYTKLYVPQMHF